MRVEHQYWLSRMWQTMWIFPPKVFIGESIEQIRVVGLAVAYTHVIE